MGGNSMSIQGIRRGLLVAAGSLLLAGAALAGAPNLRLDGAFQMEDVNQGDENEACVIAAGGFFEGLGRVTATTGACLVQIVWVETQPNKASASVLKDDGSGKAAVSQQVQTSVGVEISGVECTTAPYEGQTFAEKCKSSASVNASEGDPDTVDKGKASVSCELGSEGSELVPSPTTEQVDTIVAAFTDRSDVKITDSGKLTIKTKGEGDLTAFCD
jgi:hypothetical protein